MPRSNNSNGRVVRINDASVASTKVAILLPLTLRNQDAWQNFVEFLRSFAVAFGGPITSKKLQTTTTNHHLRVRMYKYCFFVGVDVMPLEVDEEKATNHIAELFNRVLSPYRSNFDSVISVIPVGDCKTEAETFNELGKAAYQSQEACDYFILATEQIRFKHPTESSSLFQGDNAGGRAMDDVISYFKHFAVRSGCPSVGTIGCVSILDETLPSTPSIPVVHRKHLQMFQGELLPSLFPDTEQRQEEEDNVEEIRAYQEVLGLKSNLQDFIFEIHFRLGAAKILSDSIRVTRDKYDPQTRQVRHPQQADIWAKHVPMAVERYLKGIRAFGLDANSTIKRRIAMDVVVPSFRTPKHVIERILKLPRDEENLAVRIIVVCDNPMSKEAVNSLAELEKDHETDFACKIRVNKVNLGPGGTRSQGLLESPGEYVLFLDDDVLPEPVLLPEYARLIRQYPHASGFVGQTALPEAVTPKQIGFIRSRIAFGWDFARESKSDLSWGITANLCVKRRSGVLFDPVGFPKGGGGEDVDFCLRISQQNDERYFLPAPVACVHHPWWDNGNPKLHHFVCWAKGDRRLIRHHPEKSFWNLPDCIETIAALGLFVGPTLVLNGKMSLKTWLGLLMAQPLGEIVYEVISMRHADLFSSHGPIFAMKTAFYSAIVSLCHELGRFLGHVEDGIFTVPFCTQFDWYKTHRIPPHLPKQDLFRFDFAQTERLRLLKRSLCRWLIGLALCLFLKRNK